MKLDLNEKEITAALQDAFVETNEIAGRKMQQKIEDPIWGWDGETLRHRGEAVGSPRNIVDRGELVGSYSPRPGRNQYGHAWTAPHSMAVHNGAVFSDGSTMPARPFATEGLRDTKFDETFAKIARGKLEQVK